MKTGIYLCQCGGNISNTVDLNSVAEHIKKNDENILVKINSHMCSGAGQKLIIDDVKKNGLEKVVVASCSPHFHEKTFRSTLKKAGLNPYVLEIANLREHCSWIHKDIPEIATEKANDIVDAALAKAKLNYPLEEKKMQLGNEILVIGGGIAGIQTSLDLADSGKKVTLIEKLPTIGGNMAILTKTFPTEDCAACILSPKMAAILDHPNITLYTNSEIEDIVGHRLHFEARVKKHPRYIKDTVNMDLCLSCNKCTEVCPVTQPNYWEQGIIKREAIYIPAPHAIPFKYLIDAENCLHFKDNSCNKCAEVCPQNVIDFEQKEEIINVAVDSVVVATGYDIFDAKEKSVFGYGKYENVVTAMEMERIVDHIVEAEPPRKVGKRVAFVQCVGSRDEQVGNEYCSRVCCMYSVKLASLLKQAKPETDIYIFYTDLRAFGKGYEEYYKRSQKMGIKFIRGKPSHFTEDKETKQVIITVEDTLSRNIIETEFDLVVLANGLELSKSSDIVADSLKLAKSDDGFFKEAHPKYKPVDTLVEGVFLAGTAQGPKDIPDTVAQASAAAARVIATLAQKEVPLDPILAFVHQDICDGCGKCLEMCPPKAISMNADGKAAVNEALCLGCGSCIESCPIEALDLNYYTNKQLYAEIEAALKFKKENEKRILVFADDNTTYRLIDACGVRKMKYTNYIRVLRIPSGSRVTPNLIQFAFAKGADAVFIGDSPEKSSRFEWANEITNKNLKVVKKKLKELNIESERLVFSQFTAADLMKFITEIDQLADKIDKMQPITDELKKQLLPNKEK
ncbi:MAG: hydrogenase iron-sulfur subunit [Candidatus Cloacimonetes bacterium]|nr:hydrogenase iron-sulfur subunit [Candidatus Cloacimonadota bacterium]